MTSTIITDYIGRGLHVDRPVSPPVSSGATAIYFETDTNKTFVWSGSVWVEAYSGSTTGTVTSVTMTVPGELNLSGSPITASGTLALSWANQTGNVVLASPSGGGSGTPGFRNLVSGDIPNLDTGKITTGTLALARLSGITTTELSATAGIVAGQIASVNPSVLTGSGTVPLAGLSGITTAQLSATAGITSGQIASIPNQNASIITTGILATARGGTGVDSSTASNGQLLIGNGSGLALATLTAGSNITITNGSGTITINSTGGGGSGNMKWQGSWNTTTLFAVDDVVTSSGVSYICTSVPAVSDTRIDTFVRPNQVDWGTASGGFSWTVDRANGSTAPVAISTNHGLITQDNGSGHYETCFLHIGSDLAASDVEVLLRWKIITGGDAAIRITLRSDPSINQATWYIHQNGGVDLFTADIGSGGFESPHMTWAGASSGTVLWVRARAEGSTYSFRVWVDGSSEPGVWDGQITSARNPTSTGVYLVSYLPVNGDTIAIDSFSAVTLIPAPAGDPTHWFPL